jgi:hypothetical protein
MYRLLALLRTIACAGALTGCIGLYADAPETVEIPRARARSAPVSVPIGCLTVPGCWESSTGRESIRSGDTVTFMQVVRRGVVLESKASSDPQQFDIDAAMAARRADAYLTKIAKEFRAVRREALYANGPMPKGQYILGPPTEAFLAQVNVYINGEDFFNCRLVFEAMTRANTDIADKSERTAVLWDLFLRYLDACNKGKLDTLGSARDRLVVFFRKDLGGRYFPFCLGFNFAANYVLTAHHCVVDPGAIDLVASRYAPDDPEAYVDVAGPIPTSRAVVLGEAGRLFELKVPQSFQQRLNFYPFEPDQDAIVLELHARDRRKVEPFPMAAPTQWANIVMTGLYAEDEVLATALETGKAEDVTRVVNDSAAVDISPLCSSVYSTKSSKPFVYHRCQTRYGYSGGPILQRGADGSMILVGVHTGTVDGKNPVDGWPYTMLFPNYGLRLPEFLMKMAE